jgi:type IV secretory pathway VirB10-like protein
MSEALKLGGEGESGPRIRRLNRVPIIVAIVLVVTFFGIIIYGLSSRGLRFGSDELSTTPGSGPASRFGDQLTQGVPDGIIGEPAPIVLQPAPALAVEDTPEPVVPTGDPIADPSLQRGLESEEAWRARIEREQDEQLLRELQRQRMAALQADSAAYDSPIAVSLQGLEAVASESAMANSRPTPNAGSGLPSNAADLYAAAMQAGLPEQNDDPNGQDAKADFFNQDIRDLGYLPNRVVDQISPFELKRGSVVPATLVTGVNSDLPGRLIAQVSQNVFDSATGRLLLIPQGSKLFGRYDSEVTQGQSRVLVIWTDIVFPNGSTLQIGGMAGADPAGYGGFKDQVDTHFFETFGSAILVALIGAGTDMLLPSEGQGTDSNSPENSVRESFAETFSELTEQTTSRNMNVQPTLEIRPGYRFNVLVDQDIVFPRSF